MQRYRTALISGLGILLTTGCYDAPEPIGLERVVAGLADGGLSRLNHWRHREWGFVPVPHSRVLVYLVGPIPPDTVPPDTVPPDTTGVSQTAYALPVAMFRSDSVPGDSTPPPPPIGCGERGLLVARVRSDRNGHFDVGGLAPGVYDVRAKGRGGQGTICALILREGQQAFVGITLTKERGGASR